jgi:hypothetical protein
VNNAGISTRASLLSGPLEDVALEMETHDFGTLNVTRGLVPIVECNGGGAILNVLSVLTWVHVLERGLLRGQGGRLGVDRHGQLCPVGPEDRSGSGRQAGA